MTAADVTLLTLIWRPAQIAQTPNSQCPLLRLNSSKFLPESAFSVPGPSVLGGKPNPLVLRVAGPLGLLGLPWTPELDSAVPVLLWVMTAELGSTVAARLWVLLWVPELASAVALHLWVMTVTQACCTFGHKLLGWILFYFYI